MNWIWRTFLHANVFLLFPIFILQVMEDAITSGACDIVGLARPLCNVPDGPKQLFGGQLSELPSVDQTLTLGPSVYTAHFGYSIFSMPTALMLYISASSYNECLLLVYSVV